MNSLQGSLCSRLCGHKGPGAQPHGILDQWRSGQCISTPTRALIHPHSVMISSDLALHTLCKCLPTDAHGSDRIGALCSLSAFRDLLSFQPRQPNDCCSSQNTPPPFYTLLSTVLPSAFPSNPASSPEASWLDKQTDPNKHAEFCHTHSFTEQTKYGCFAVCWDTLVNTD